MPSLVGSEMCIRDSYEFDETITLSIGAVGVDLTNANKASSNTELMITVTNAGELAPVLTLSRALQPDNASLISGSSVTASSYLETVTSDDETTNNPYFEVKIVDPTSGANTEAGMDLKFAYNTSGTSTYGVLPATAGVGEDYTEVTTGVATISAGSSTKSFSIDILDDEIDEEDQNVKITIAKIGYDGNGDDVASDAAAGDDENALTDDVDANMSHVFTILDVDDPPVAYFYELESVNITANTETQTVEEQDATAGTAGTKTITVKTTLRSEKTMTLYYSTITTGCNSTGGCA